MKRWLLIFALATPLAAQINAPPTHINGTRIAHGLPVASSASGQLWAVTDGASATDCTTGGGTTYVLCYSNGTSWAAYSGGGSGTVNSGSGYALPAYGSTASTTVGPSGITTDSTGNNLYVPGKVAVNGSYNGTVDLTSAGSLVPTGPAASTVRLTAPNSVTAYSLELPGAAPTAGSTIMSCTAATPSVCSFVAGNYPAPQTLTASSSAELDFTSCITSTYQDYEIRFSDLVPASTGANLMVQVSTNGGSSYDSTSGNYIFGDMYIGVNQAQSATGEDNLSFSGFWIGGYSSAPGALDGTLTLFNLPNSTASKQAILHVDSNNNGTYFFHTGGEIYTQTAAVNAVRIIATTGNITSGKATCQPLVQ